MHIPKILLIFLTYVNFALLIISLISEYSTAANNI